MNPKVKNIARNNNNDCQDPSHIKALTELKLKYYVINNSKDLVLK